MEQPYQSLLEENVELRKALSVTKELVERFRIDNEGLKRTHEDFKIHYEKLKDEKMKLQKGNTEMASAMKEMRMNYQAQVSRLHHNLEQQRKEIGEQMRLMTAPPDSDVLRMKLINEIEAPHRAAIESLQNDINTQEAKVHQLSSQLELLQQESRNYKLQAEKEYQDLEQRYMTERTNYAHEVQALHAQIEELSDPEPIRILRKERDDLRRRVTQQSSELEDLAKTRERLKSEMNVLKLQTSHDLDEERDLRLAASSDRDSLQLQLKDVTSQLAQLRLQYDLKSQQTTSIGKERDEIKVSSKVFEDQVVEYRMELGRVKDEMQRKITDLELKLKRTVEVEEQKVEKEKQEKERLQKELENMEKVWRGAEEKGNERGGKGDLEKLERMLRAEQEEVALLKASASKMQQENDQAKETSARLKDREEQLRALQAQFRSKDSQVHELQTSLKALEETIRANDRELASFRAKASSEDTRNRIIALKAKVREYKAKVRLSNEKLQEYGRKLATIELERQRLAQVLQAKEGVSSQLSSIVGPQLAYENARQRRDISEMSSRLAS